LRPIQPIPYGAADSHTFAAALISFGQALFPPPPAASFNLPRFRLTVASDSGGYLEICHRALVSDPAFDPDLRLDLSVPDYQTHPEMPRGMWTGGMFGLGLLAKGLAPSGIEGSLNPDYKLVQFFDASSGTGIEALARPGQFPPWIASFPLRNFLHWAYQRIGWRLVHAGTLAIDGRGVMLVGDGGSGKSGTVLAGILAGLDSAGDDYVVMEASGEGVRARPVVKLMKLDPAGLRRLGLDPHARSFGTPNWQGKHEFDFEALGKGRRARTIDLKAIVLPRIAHTPRSSLSRATPHDAMLGLAPSNLQQLPGGWREGLAFTAGIARRLPAFYLDLSDDPLEIADVIAAVVEGRRP
jgi:hypothetical protein